MQGRHNTSACGALFRYFGAATFAIWFASLCFIVFSLSAGGAPFGMFIYFTPFAIFSGAIWYGTARLLGAIGAGAQDAYTKRLARQAALEVEELRQRLLEMQSSEPFMLYLRPFYSDQVLTRNPVKSHLPFLPSFYHPTPVPWEMALVDALRPFERVVSFGYPSAHVTADRLIASDEQWAETFILLACYARCIIIWPSTRPGTLWELQWLRDKGALGRCIFVAPRNYQLQVPEGAALWTDMTAALSSVAVQPPPCAGFMFTDRGDMEHLDLTTPRLIRRSFRRLLATRVASTETSEQRWASYLNALVQLQRSGPVPASSAETIRDTLLTDLRCVQCGHLLNGIVCDRCEQ